MVCQERVYQDLFLNEIILYIINSCHLFRVPKSSLLQGDWILYQESTPRYLIINATDAGMMNQSMPFLNRLSFWDGLIE